MREIDSCGRGTAIDSPPGMIVDESPSKTTVFVPCDWIRRGEDRQAALPGNNISESDRERSREGPPPPKGDHGPSDHGPDTMGPIGPLNF